MNWPLAAEFSELVEASRNLPNATVGLGRVELPADELRSVLKRLTPAARPPGDAKAHYLLAGSGFNAEQVLGDIQQIKSTAAARKKRTHHERAHKKGGGVDAFLASKKDHSALQGVDTLVAASVRDFEQTLSVELSGDWSNRKTQIYQLLGIVGESETTTKSLDTLPSGPRSSHGRAGPQVLGDPEPLPDPRTDRAAAASWERVRDFGAVMTHFNGATLRARSFDLVGQLSAVTHKHDPGNMPQLVDMWNLVESGDAKAWLEQQYRTYIDAEVVANLTEARVGGVPSPYAKVRALVQLKHSKNGVWDDRLALVNKTPIWAQLWYLVRAGYFKEALQVVLERNDIFELVGSTFAAAFKAWVQSPGHVLAPHYVELVRSEYTQARRNASEQQNDPFKQALLKVIGRCDLQRRSLPGVATTTEDWLWLQLTLVRDANTADFGTDKFDLSDLQTAIRGIGSDYFGGAENPAKYFGVLMLVGLYDEALSHLVNSKNIWAEQVAVHYAIALQHRGMLAQTPGGLDFSRTIGRYTRLFRQSQSTLAVEYLVQINRVDPQACREALQELVLETRHFSELLGDVSPSTDKTLPGAIELRMELLGLPDKRSYLRVIAHQAAVKADADGRTLDAILLYRLANEPDKVMVMVNYALGQTLASVQVGQPVGSAPPLLPAEHAGFAASGDPLALARNLMRLSDSTGGRGVRAESRNTCLVLLSVAEALDLLAAAEYDRCLECINGTGLVVLSPEADITQIRELAQQFTRFNESVSRNIPSVLLAAMTCCIQRTAELRASQNPASVQLAGQYRRIASNCMVYAGLVQYRMPRDMYAHLTQLEASLGL